MGCSETRPAGSRFFLKLENGEYSVEYADFTRYIGQLKNSKRSGNGEFISETETYRGEWVEDKKSGEGCSYYNDKFQIKFRFEKKDIDRHNLFYIGRWYQDKKQGYGVLGSTKFKYIGQWYEDQMHGKGEIVIDKWGKYEGDWEKGAQHGQGTAFYENKNVYTGTWFNGLMEGYGKIQFFNGFEYKGEFRENFIGGKGSCKSPSGKVYFSPYMPILEHIGRIFFTEGETLPENGGKINCLCISDEWNVYEGWIEFGENEAQTVLNSDSKRVDITSNLKGEGTLYFTNKNYIKGSWKSEFQFEGNVISNEIYDKNYREAYLGGIYEGQFCGRIKHGYGIFEYNDHKIYKGMWNSNKIQGFGTITYLDGGFYRGIFNEVDKNDFGTKFFANGDIFKGVFLSNQPESGEMKFKNGEIFYGRLSEGIRGVYKYLNGDYYKGEMYDYKKQGNGVMNYADGSVYKGNWDKDQKHGFGVFTLKTGWYYQGQWNNGEMHGIGITSEDPTKLFLYKKNKCLSEIKPPGKESYKGKHSKGNVKHGDGKMTWANGQNYNGSWKFDEFDGEGNIMYTDGSSYRGNFSKGLYNGRGSFKEADGNEIRATWKDNKVKGTYEKYLFNNGDELSKWIKNSDMPYLGHYKFPNGLQYWGTSETDIFHGYGTMTSKNEVYNGAWHDGLKHGNGDSKDKYGNIYFGDWDMGKKQGKFKIDFKTNETLFITFDNDLPVGEGELHLNTPLLSEKNSSELNIINVTWDSEEIQGILKKLKNIRKYGVPMNLEDSIALLV